MKRKSEQFLDEVSDNGNKYEMITSDAYHAVKIEHDEMVQKSLDSFCVMMYKSNNRCKLQRQVHCKCKESCTFYSEFKSLMENR